MPGKIRCACQAVKAEANSLLPDFPTFLTYVLPVRHLHRVSTTVMRREAFRAGRKHMCLRGGVRQRMLGQWGTTEGDADRLRHSRNPHAAGYDCRPTQPDMLTA